MKKAWLTLGGVLFTPLFLIIEEIHSESEVKNASDSDWQ